ncbi:MAG: hypothetical protein R2705_01480 [Ilumatobacteraceae bacterium]
MQFSERRTGSRTRAVGSADRERLRRIGRPARRWRASTDAAAQAFLDVAPGMPWLAGTSTAQFEQRELDQ